MKGPAGHFGNNNSICPPGIHLAAFCRTMLRMTCIPAAIMYYINIKVQMMQQKPFKQTVYE
jgi:hypothetical protein